MNMTTEQLTEVLVDTLHGYAKDFKVIAQNAEYVFLEAVGGHLDDHAGELLEYRVHKLSEFVEDGNAFYRVEVRQRTGWEDAPHGEWRWSTHIQEPFAGIHGNR